MFEGTKPKPNPHGMTKADRIGLRHVPNGDLPACAQQADGVRGEAVPLRQIEWSELTARLSAVRDLRHVLRKDMSAKIGSDKLAFAEAAASFFRANEEDERGVNPNALGQGKPSSDISQDLTSTPDIQIPSAASPSKEVVGMGDTREEQ